MKIIIDHEEFMVRGSRLLFRFRWIDAEDGRTWLFPPMVYLSWGTRA